MTDRDPTFRFYRVRKDAIDEDHREPGTYNGHYRTGADVSEARAKLDAAPKYVYFLDKRRVPWHEGVN